MTLTAEGVELHDLLTLDDAAAFLHVSRRTLYTWMRRGLLPFARTPGGRRRIRRRDLLRGAPATHVLRAARLAAAAAVSSGEHP